MKRGVPFLTLGAAVLSAAAAAAFVGSAPDQGSAHTAHEQGTEETR
jgi:hypothetical protein